MRKLVSIVTPTFNELDNVDELVSRISAEMKRHKGMDYEHIIIDNASTDGTQERLRELASRDRRIRVILNSRNFGHIRSPYHGIMQARGDAVVLLAADLQDPPEMIDRFIEKWQQGYLAVMAVKKTSKESRLMFGLRRSYYSLLDKISEVPQVQNATGAGLYDRVVIEALRKMRDPYPYFRGLIVEVGFPIATVEFEQPRRARGVTKNNFFTLYDIAVLGLTKHSKVPLRLAALTGFAISMLSLLASIVFLILKLAFWDSFSAGVAPLVVGMFFLSGIQIMFLGIIGEYIGNISTQVRDMPLVIEAERLNFDKS
jgi:glycosyltransferase involved in cell wall biosynthesis